MKINIPFQIGNKNYLLIEINEEYKEQIECLFNRSYDYFYLIEGRKANEESINDFLQSLPPGKSVKDKHTLGIFNNENLVGVIDLIEAYPNKDEWIIGLILIDSDERGHGVGEKVHKILIGIAKEGQAQKLRIGVVEQNKKALGFWTDIGYKEIKRTEPIKYGDRESIVIVMNYLI